MLSIVRHGRYTQAATQSRNGFCNVRQVNLLISGSQDSHSTTVPSHEELEPHEYSRLDDIAVLAARGQVRLIAILTDFITMSTSSNLCIC